MTKSRQKLMSLVVAVMYVMCVLVSAPVTAYAATSGHQTAAVSKTTATKNALAALKALPSTKAAAEAYTTSAALQAKVTKADAAIAVAKKLKLNYSKFTNYGRLKIAKAAVVVLKAKEKEAADALAAEEKAAADKVAADKVTALIALIPATVAVTDEAAVTAADVAYKALTADQMKLVTTYATVTAALTKITDLKNALAISEVKATAAKVLSVKFNRNLTADEKTKVTFAFKVGTSTLTLSAPTWAENVATFTRLDSAALVAGTYEVTVGGAVTTALVKTGAVVAETATTMEITTARVKPGVNAAQSLAYTVKNQYGEAMTVAVGLISATAYNMTNMSRAVTAATALNTMNFNACSLADVVRVTAFLTSDPTIKTTKDITVANISTGAMSFGTEILPTGVTRLTTLTAGVKFPVTLADDAGTALTLTTNAGPIATGTVIDGLTLNYTGINTVSVNADGQIVATLGVAGTATLQLVNAATGNVVTKTFTIVAAPDTAEIAMAQPTTPIRMGGGAQTVPFTLKDQFGGAFTVATAGWATADVVLSSSNPAVATVAWAGNTIAVTPVSAGNVTIYANVATPVATAATAINTLNLTIAAAKAPTTVTLSGTPTTSLANGQTVLLGATTGALKFLVKDQDGAAVNLAATTAVGVKLNIAKTDASSVLAAPAATVFMAADMSATTGTTNGITVTAHATNLGTASLTATLFNDADGDDVMDAGEALSSFVTVNYTVSAPVLTSGAFTAITGGTGANDAEFTATYEATANTVLTYKYNLLDQAGNNLTTVAANSVSFTVVNNSDQDITVNNGTANTLIAGATGTYAKDAAAGANANATITIAGTAAAIGKINVSAVATGVATPDTTVTYYHAAAVAAGTTYSGTVVALDKTANFMILNTAVGYVLVTDYTAGTEVLTVDGNTATVTAFEAALTINDTAVASMTGANVSVALTNH